MIYGVPTGAVKKDDWREYSKQVLRDMNDWFAAQTGGSRFVLDTYKGELDVTLEEGLPVLSQSTTGFGGLYPVASMLGQRGWSNSTDRVLIIIYQGPPPAVRCGEAGWNIAMIHRDDTGVCPRPQWPWASLAHEVVHVHSVASPCMTGADAASHFPNEATDVMGRGLGNPGSMTIDSNRSLYYGTGSPNCPDLARSPFWDRPPSNVTITPGPTGIVDACAERTGPCIGPRR